MVSVLSFSEAGGHPLNEDSFIVVPHSLDPDCWLCFLADGQGGQPGGGPAAELACRSAHAAAERCPPDRLLDPAAWPGILRRADLAVEAHPAAGYTTLVGLGIFAGCVAGASSGDSAALLISGGKAHELTAGQRKNPPVGSGAAVALPFAAGVQPPWLVLVMSDGVWKFVGWERVVEIASHERGAAVVEALQRSARVRERGPFQDDFTVVLMQDAA
jgi:serine/threonine protein phosphatase PrpC